MALSVAANLLLLRLAAFPTWRFVFLLAMSTLLLALAIFDRVQARTLEDVRASPSRSLTASSVFAPAAVTVTGGLRSPFVPVLLVHLVAIVVLWRQGKVDHGLWIGVAALMAILAIAPDVVTGPVVPRPYFDVMMALSVVTALSLGVRVVSDVFDGFVVLQRSLSTVRERAFDAAVQQKRSLLQIGAKVGHELRNPLAAVKSLLQLEAEAIAAGHGGEALRPEVERSRRRVEVMSREVARMETLLRDYLSFSRPLEDLCIGAIDLAEVADVVVLLLAGRAAAAGVRLERTGGVVRVEGDARRLEEALLNVVTNAIEATPAGGAVTIRTECRDGLRAIVVHDTGKGISAAILEKVGTPFFTMRREGTGLGVLLARAALVQHGGRLDYASRPGEGTTVTLALPERTRSTGSSKAAESRPAVST